LLEDNQECLSRYGEITHRETQIDSFRVRLSYSLIRNAYLIAFLLTPGDIRVIIVESLCEALGISYFYL